MLTSRINVRLLPRLYKGFQDYFFLVLKQLMTIAPASYQQGRWCYWLFA